MPAKNHSLFSLILVLSDFVVLLAAFTAAYILRVQFDYRPLVNEITSIDYFLSFLAIVPFWIIIFACLGLYSPSTYNRRFSSLTRLLLGCTIGIMLVITWEYVGNNPIFPARLVAAYALVASFVLIALSRELTKFLHTLLHRRGRGTERILLIGSSPIARDLIDSIHENPDHEIIAVTSTKKPKDKSIKYFPDTSAALAAIKRLRINHIIQADLYENSLANQSILAASQKHHIRYSFIPGEPEFYSGKNTLDFFFGYPRLTVFQTPLVGWSVFFKRAFDLLLLLLLSPLLLPLFLLLVICQRLFNPGPIFFKQTRLSRYKKRFQVYKFRSMKSEYCGQDAISIFKNMGRPDLAREYSKTRKIKNDPRISTFGRILRRTSLDELAQILNVLRGEMSLVGPRPILPDELEFYKNRSPLLLSIKPGLTSLASVSGRSTLSFERRVNIELHYAQNWSFLLDLKIIAKTIQVVLSRSGAE
ncbi:sugar transferase [Candidatus Saccharibacteria bacterium]|nr:sugar transferase [Candidatus Saccharibacteria bacterium]